MPRVKDWCFTINNPTEEDGEAVLALPHKYLVFQVEIGEQGTPHIQGFVQMKKRTTSERMSRLLSRAHLEVRKGTAEQAAHYCKKPVGIYIGLPNDAQPCQCQHCQGCQRFDNFQESGVLDTTEQGTRTDINLAVEACRNGGLRAVKAEYPTTFIKYPRGFAELAQSYVPPRDFKTTVTVLWGKAGTGKTRYAMTGPTPYKAPVITGDQDWTGPAYDPTFHQTYILDDFYGQWKFTTFLHVADR